MQNPFKETDIREAEYERRATSEKKVSNKLNGQKMSAFPKISSPLPYRLRIRFEEDLTVSSLADYTVRLEIQGNTGKPWSLRHTPSLVALRGA